ncbi:hypothetical protein [Gymnodinialimonas sp.]
MLCHCLVALVALASPAAAAMQVMTCVPDRACAGTACRDAAGLSMDFDVRFDASTAHVTFEDDTLPRTEALQRGGTSEGAAVYFFNQPDLRVALQVFAAETPMRARLAFGAPDAPDAANQIFATCQAGPAS